MINRRIFLKDGALAVMGLSMVPGFVYRTALAAQPRLRRGDAEVARKGEREARLDRDAGGVAVFHHGAGRAIHRATGSGQDQDRTAGRYKRFH